MIKNLDAFVAELKAAKPVPRAACEAVVRRRFVRAYQVYQGAVPVDTGARRAAVPFEGEEPGGEVRTGEPVAHPGDGPARVVADGFDLGDLIGFVDNKETRQGDRYGVYHRVWEPGGDFHEAERALSDGFAQELEAEADERLRRTTS